MDTILIKLFKQFAQVSDNEQLSITEISPSPLHSLFDHGFIADQAPVWSESLLVGCEIAIISRTYDNPITFDSYPGLKIIQLPELTKKFDNYSVSSICIATVIDPELEWNAKTIANINSFLDACRYLSIYDLSHVLPSKIQDTHYIGVFYSHNQTKLKVLKSED